MKQVNGPGTESVRVESGKLPRSVHGRIHVQHHLFECPSLYEPSKTRQGSLTFAIYSHSLAGRHHSPLVKGSLPNAVLYFQGVQGKDRKAVAWPSGDTPHRPAPPQIRR